MPNSYYNQSNTFTNFALARGDHVNTEIDAIEAGFDAVEAAIIAVGGTAVAAAWGNSFDTRWFAGTTTGSSNAYSITPAGPPDAADTIGTGYRMQLKFNATNTGSITLNIGTSEGAVTVQKYTDAGAKSNLASGDIDTSRIYELVYDGSNWILDWSGDTRDPYSTVSQVEAEAGTATTVRNWTAQRVSQAAEASGTTATADEMYLGTSTTVRTYTPQRIRQSSIIPAGTYTFGTAPIATFAALNNFLKGKAVENAVTIKFPAGTQTVTAAINVTGIQAAQGTARLRFIGDNSTPSNVMISNGTNSGTIFEIGQTDAQVEIAGMVLDGNGGSGSGWAAIYIYDNTASVFLGNGAAAGNNLIFQNWRTAANEVIYAGPRAKPRIRGVQFIQSSGNEPDFMQAAHDTWIHIDSGTNCLNIDGFTNKANGTAFQLGGFVDLLIEGNVNCEKMAMFCNASDNCRIHGGSSRTLTFDQISTAFKTLRSSTVSNYSTNTWTNITTNYDDADLVYGQVNMDANQSAISAGAEDKLFDQNTPVEASDVGGWWDNVTNYRLDVAFDCLIHLSTYLITDGDAGNMTVQYWVDGTQAWPYADPASNDDVVHGGSVILQVNNGSYIEVYCRNINGSTSRTPQLGSTFRWAVIKRLNS